MYESLTPYAFQTFYPEEPYHAGSSGWSRANVPGWGQNSLLQGPARLATGAVEVGRSYGPVYVGTGEDASGPSKWIVPTLFLTGLGAFLYLAYKDVSSPLPTDRGRSWP